MSYSTVGAISTDKEKGADFIATWLSFKQAMEDKLGIYRDASGGILTLNGKTEPMITTTLFNTISSWLTNVGRKAILLTATNGRPTDRMTGALSDFISGVGGIRARIATYEAQFGPGSANSFSGRMPLPITTDFMNVCETFALGMSGGQWMSFNEGTKLELFQQALDETPGGSILTPFLDLGGLVGNVLKIAVYGGAALGAIWLYTKLKR